MFVYRFTWHKASEDEPGDGDRGLVSPMRLTSGDEEATLPFPNRELRIRNFRRRRISMLLLACLLYLLESYAFACLLALLTRIQRLFALVYRFTWHKASEDEPGDGDRGLVSPMRLASGDEEATLPIPNRELRIRNSRRRRISMLCLLACLLTY